MAATSGTGFKKQADQDCLQICQVCAYLGNVGRQQPTFPDSACSYEMENLNLLH